MGTFPGHSGCAKREVESCDLVEMMLCQFWVMDLRCAGESFADNSIPFGAAQPYRAQHANSGGRSGVTTPLEVPLHYLTLWRSQPAPRVFL